jgi:hypothetical protein
VLVALLLPVTALAADTSRSEKVSFYFAAHEDDWQLFMDPSAFEDVTGGAVKTVFVHVTAGDDGLGVGSGGRKQPYYLARENGALNAIRFMADADKTPIDTSTSTIIFNGHSIYRVSYLSTIGYFLRLPDGNASGSGFAGTGFQSLKRLATGDMDSLSTIDGSTIYHGWNDLVETVRDVLKFERGQVPLVQLNVPDTDPRINPQDHSDHLMTAKAALDATKDIACVRRVYYVDYASSKLPENLNPAQRDIESAVFAVTLNGVMAFDHGTAWHHYDQAFIGRNYFRVEEPRDHCGVTSAEFATAKY